MLNSFAVRLSRFLSVPAILLTIGTSATMSVAQPRIYNPKPLPPNNQVSDTLSREDIPTGQGGFARDYIVELNEGDQVVFDLTSDQFDTILTLLAADGSTVAENDDGPDGSTNSLLFARITDTATYVVRVRAFGETRGGTFNLKMTRLRSIE